MNSCGRSCHDGVIARSVATRQSTGRRSGLLRFARDDGVLMSKSFVAFAAALAAVPASAEMPSPPRLLVVISVDQLSADLFDEYRPQFAGGLARLSRGTVFRNG